MVFRGTIQRHVALLLPPGCHHLVLSRVDIFGTLRAYCQLVARDRECIGRHLQLLELDAVLMRLHEVLIHCMFLVIALPSR